MKTGYRFGRVFCALLILAASLFPASSFSMDMLGPELEFKLPAPNFGDLNEMKKRGMIRVVTCYSRTGYFLDGAHQRGVTYELMRAFEKYINKKLGNPTIAVHVVMIPVARNELFKCLAEGRADIAASNLTITKLRSLKVDFADPFGTGVKEVVVVGPDAPAPATIDDLAGKEIHVRKSSSFYTHLKELNKDFAARGLEPIKIELVDEYLETEDILEMVGVGLVPMTVADSHVAGFWKTMIPELNVVDDVAVNTGGEIAWAVRKGCPKLKDMVDAFVKTHKAGTLNGNVLIKRYYEKNPWVKNALARTEMKRFMETLPVFKKYGEKYDFDYLMLVAQGFQESRLNQDLVSRRGAIGIMQLLPSTAADPSVGIKNIKTVESNIHAGVKYMRHIREQYFNDPALDDLNTTLFSFAAYNAGPNRIARLRRKAADMNLDPNIWFSNVERVVAKEVGRETVNYVRNIAKYYYAYRTSIRQLETRDKGKTESGNGLVGGTKRLWDPDSSRPAGE